MDNSSLMNRENKKRQLRRQIVPPRYQTEEESEQAIRNPFTIIRSCGRRAWQRKIRKQQ